MPSPSECSDDPDYATAGCPLMNVAIPVPRMNNHPRNLRVCCNCLLARNQVLCQQYSELEGYRLDKLRWFMLAPASVRRLAREVLLSSYVAGIGNATWSCLAAVLHSEPLYCLLHRDLSRNVLSGTLPKSWSSLTSMTHL